MYVCMYAFVCVCGTFCVIFSVIERYSVSTRDTLSKMPRHAVLITFFQLYTFAHNNNSQGKVSLQSALMLARQIALEVVELMEGTSNTGPTATVTGEGSSSHSNNNSESECIVPWATVSIPFLLLVVVSHQRASCRTFSPFVCPHIYSFRLLIIFHFLPALLRWFDY